MKDQAKYIFSEQKKSLNISEGKSKGKQNAYDLKLETPFVMIKEKVQARTSDCPFFDDMKKNVMHSILQRMRSKKE